MNQTKISFKAVSCGVIAVLWIVFIAWCDGADASLVGNGDGACINSGTECQCSETSGGGQCMRHQGRNKCLMGECSAGYRCDCFGFEVCSQRSCALYTTMQNVIPSANKLFGCHLTDNAGNCVEFSKFVDSVSGAGNAQAASEWYNEGSFGDERNATEAIQKIEEDVQVANAAVQSVFRLGDEVPDEEYEELAVEENEMISCARRALDEKAGAAVESGLAFKAFSEASKYRAKAQTLEKEADEAEKEEKSERKKARDNDKKNCNRCDVLQERVKKLRKQRREAAIAAGTWAKTGRGHKDKAKKKVENCKRQQLSAAESRKKCVERAKKILRRLNRLP